MKTIGLIGGMSWESTLVYYQNINLSMKEILGDSHSAKIVMYSFDYYELEKMLEKGDWETIEKRMTEEALKLESIGAQMILLCANTMHIVAKKVEEKLNVPLIHIVKETKKEALSMRLKRVLLLGTLYTMKSPIYKDIFKEDELEVLTPNQRDQAHIHRIIYKELILGIFKNDSKQALIHIIDKFEVDGVILGCTELPLLIKKSDLKIPILNTLEIHVKAAVQASLNETV